MGRRIAHGVSEVLAPPVVALGIIVAVALTSAGSIAGGLGWAGLACLFTWVVPYAVVLVGVRRGRLGDKFLTQRRERVGPMLLACASAGVGVVVLARLGAPADLVRLVGAVLAGLLVSVGVTTRWKVSVHVAGLAGALAVAVVHYGGWALAGIPVLALVGWARVTLEAHTVAQVLAGACLGAGVTGATFALLR